jgi:hypothetical protein
VTTDHPRARDDRRVRNPDAAGEVDMQTPKVTEISRQSQLDARQAWHQMQVRLVRESLIRGGQAGAKRA